MSGGVDGRRELRWMYRLAVVAAVCPIVVSAVRNGLAGWQPTGDAAILAVRTRDVFSAHPPLYGFASSVSLDSGSLYSYPSGWMYYLLSVPVHLLGTTWGMLSGMAAINIAACVSAVWLIRRRAGERLAILGCGFVVVILWTIGSQAMIDSSEMSSDLLMVFTFLVAAWCVADKDALAMPVLALSGNYLLLTLLRYQVLVPIVGFWCLAVYFVRLRRLRRLDRPGWSVERRSHLRSLGGAVAVTVIAWIPPLIDQLFGSGNLGKLAQSALGGGLDHAQSAQMAPTLSGAAGVLVSITATPRWWFPPSYAQPPFDPFGGGESFAWRFGWSMVLLGVVLGAVALSWRRRDRTALVALGTACVAWVSLFVTLMLNPSPGGFFVVWYFNALWPMAAFIWFTIVFAYARGLPRVLDVLRGRGRPAAVAGCAVTVVIMALALPHRNAYKSSQSIPQVSQVRAAAAVAFQGDGPVLIGDSDFGAKSRFQAPVMLGLQDVGVKSRVSAGWAAQQFGSFRSTMRHDAVVEVVVSHSAQPPPGGRLVGVARAGSSSAPVVGAMTFARYDAKMRDWARSLTELRVRGDLGIGAARRGSLNDMAARVFAAARGADGSLLASEAFVGLVEAGFDEGHGSLFAVPGLSSKQVRNWASEQHRRLQPGPTGVKPVYLYKVPVKPPSCIATRENLKACANPGHRGRPPRVVRRGD